MRRFALLLLTTGLAMFGQANHDLGYDDTPMLPGLPFHVHDPQRPHPPVVTPAAQVGGAPSDAIVLFDGKLVNGDALSQWQSAKGNWKVGDGYFEVAPGAGDLATKQKFGDVQLHIEWAAPAEIRGTSQNRGNSGIYLQGRYEIQVLDSYQNVTYADGQASAVYGQYPPLVNASLPPGQWQTYDIIFHGPRFDKDGNVTRKARVTVFHNGVLTQDNVEPTGPTAHKARPPYKPTPEKLPLSLQDHNHPVRYRNIWVRELQ